MLTRVLASATETIVLLVCYISPCYPTAGQRPPSTPFHLALDFLMKKKNEILRVLGIEPRTPSSVYHAGNPLVEAGHCLSVNKLF